MNDSELDEVLDSWKAPETPRSLRAGVRAGFHGRVKRTVRWWGKGLMATAAALALFVFVTKAAPQKGRLGMLLDAQDTGHPYTVVSEFARYGKDGSPTVEMYGTSYNDKHGREHILARHIPDNSVHDVLARILDAASDATFPLLGHLMRLSQGGAEMMAKREILPTVATECVGKACLSVASYTLPKAAGNPAIGCADGGVVDRETILDYPTVAIRLPLDGDRMRRTVWMAPALACFALRVETEKQLADGSFRLWNGKQAIKVRLQGQ